MTLSSQRGSFSYRSNHHRMTIVISEGISVTRIENTVPSKHIAMLDSFA